jgi:hypothetical protein
MGPLWADTHALHCCLSDAREVVLTQYVLAVAACLLHGSPHTAQISIGSTARLAALMPAMAHTTCAPAARDASAAGLQFCWACCPAFLLCDCEMPAHAATSISRASSLPALVALLLSGGVLHRIHTGYARLLAASVVMGTHALCNTRVRVFVGVFPVCLTVSTSVLSAGAHVHSCAVSLFPLCRHACVAKQTQQQRQASSYQSC